MEVILHGGNMSKVTSDGQVIYKDIKPLSHTIHRLLKYIEERGFEKAPRFLDVDKNNREVLSFVAGNIHEDYPQSEDLSENINTVRNAARLLREYHDSTLGFELQENDCWFLEYTGELNKEVICHNDFAPYNVTFINNEPVGIIDFDTACPAPREWDIAYGAYRFVPLSGEVYDCKEKKYRKYNKDKDCTTRKILLREFLAAYGINVNILPYVILRLKSLVELFDIECTKGNEAFIKMKAEGHQDFYIGEIKFIEENSTDWLDLGDSY